MTTEKAEDVRDTLIQACQFLDEAGEQLIAAQVSLAIEHLAARYGIDGEPVAGLSNKLEQPRRAHAGRS